MSLLKRGNLEKKKKEDWTFIIKFVYSLPLYVFLHFYGCISPHYELILFSRVLDVI